MTDLQKTFTEKYPDITKIDEPLAKHCTYKIGGDAEVFIEPKSSQQLIDVFRFLVEKNIKYFILGGGANVLIPDEGIKGVVLHPKNRELEVEGKIVKTGAGLPLAKLAQESAAAGLTGLEWTIAVPGTVGGAIRGNAGAFGGEVVDNLVSARVFDGKEIKTLSNDEMNFRYRSSRIKDAQGKELVIDAIFELEEGDAEEAKAKVKELLKKKFASQPMGEFCAGCLFKNIELVPGEEKLSELSKGDPTGRFFKDIKLSHPEFIEKGKVPAGWIIDKLGFKQKPAHKGVKVSDKHANFVVNTGEGSEQAVKELAEHIKKDAKDIYGIELEEEVEFIR